MIKYNFVFAVIFFSIILMAGNVSAEWTIAETYPIPEGASGLAFDGDYLYCGIYGSNGNEIYKIDPNDGSFQLLFTAPIDDAYGLTYDGEYLWTTDHPNNPAVAIQLDWNGNVLSQFALPARYMSGIAYDDGNFWVAAYYPDPATIYKVTSGGTILQQFAAPDDQPWDICLQADSLWIADYWGDALYQVDKVDGSFIQSNASEGTDPAGIVFDGTYLWYCDNGQGGNDYLYKVDLGGGGSPEIHLAFHEYDFGNTLIGDTADVNLAISNYGTADLQILEATATLPVYFAGMALPLVIPSGYTEYLPIHFVPTNWGNYPAPFTIESNDPVDPQVAVMLNGYGVYPEQEIFVVDDNLGFYNVRTGSHTSREIEIMNVGVEDLVIQQIQLSDSLHFYLDENISLPMTISMKERAFLNLWFHSDEEGQYDCLVDVYSNDIDENPYPIDAQGNTVIFSTGIGTELWSYQTNDDFDDVVAMKKFVDITGDGISEIIVADDDYGIHCLNGNSSGNADLIWYFSTNIEAIGSGSIYQEQGLVISDDLNSDGIKDVIAGTTGGSRSIFAIDGSNGQMLWYFDTHQYGEGGWVYQVDASYDRNDDGIVDILACAGDDGQGTGPNGTMLLDGVTGQLIWRKTYGMAQFSVCSIEDINNDGTPDVLSGWDDGFVRALHGTNGNGMWANDGQTSAVFALTNIDDANGDGSQDVCYGTFDGRVIGVSSENEALWQYNLGGYAIVSRLATARYDGDQFILPSMLGSTFKLLNSQSGQSAWSFNAGSNILDSSPMDDITGDGHFDVLLGTQDGMVYVLSGLGGLEIYSYINGSGVEQTLCIDDVDGSNTGEMIVGDRNGVVKCFATGYQETSLYDGNFISSPQNSSLQQNYPNPFNPATTIQFEIPVASQRAVKLQIYDISGKLVKTLVDGEIEPGYHSVVWNGKDDAGHDVASGVYFYKLETDSYSKTKSMLLLK